MRLSTSSSQRMGSVMARQPLPRKYWSTPMSIYRTLPVGCPLSELVGRCVSAATNVEVQFSLCMGSLLGLENAASVAVFTTLRNAQARRDALRAAATHSLNEDDLEIFDVLIRIYEKLDGSRNEIVHGIWGHIDGKENEFLWCSSQSYAVWLINDYHLSQVGKLTGAWREEQWRARTFLWKASDIEMTINQISSLEVAISNFHSHLRYRGESAGTIALDQLRSEPLVQKALAELTAKAENIRKMPDPTRPISE